MRPYAFGVDIGGTAIKLGLFRTDGALLEKWQIDTRTEDGGGHVLPDALEAINAQAAHNGISWDDVEGVGVGVPGPMREDGTVLGCVNLGWGEFNVAERLLELEPRLKKARAANDVNAATLGELWQGGAKGKRSAFMVTLGTGVGGGAVLDGRIITGEAGGAGEIGHFRVEPEETEPCNCGGHGCLEQYCSANGLVRCARLALRAQPEAVTALRDDESLSAKLICDAAKEGDRLALELLDRLGRRLGWVLSAVSVTLNPQTFVIGGGLSNAGQVLLAPIERGYRSYAFRAVRETEFTLARLGNDAGIYGCVRMVL